MRIRKEAIWPTECPVRTRYKGFLYLFYSGFRLFHSSILRDSFPIRSRLSNPLDVFRLRSSLDCESYVLESVGYVTRRKRKLDFPAGTWCAASSRWSALFQLPIRRRHTIPGTGRDSSFVVKLLRALIGGECYCWRNGKIGINKDSGDPVISFQRFSRMIGSRKAEFLKISSKSRIFAAADNRNEIRPLQKIPLPSRALAWARRLLWSASSRVSAQSFALASHLQSQFNWARCTDSLRPPLWATPDITHA